MFVVCSVSGAVFCVQYAMHSVMYYAITNVKCAVLSLQSVVQTRQGAVYF